MCLVPTENMVKWKINYTLTIKSPTSAVKSITPSFYLQMISRTQRERERESIGVRNPSPLSSTHSTMRERCNSTPHTDAGLRSPHSDEQRRRTRSTQPHLHPLWALDVPNLPRQSYPLRWWSPSHFQHLRSITPMLLAKNFSQTHPLQYPIHPRPIHLRPISILTHPRPISLIWSPTLSRSISLSLNLSPFLPPSLSVWLSSTCEWMELMDFCFDNYIYWNFLL